MKRIGKFDCVLVYGYPKDNVFLYRMFSWDWNKLSKVMEHYFPQITYEINTYENPDKAYINQDDTIVELTLKLNDKSIHKIETAYACLCYGSDCSSLRYGDTFTMQGDTPRDIIHKVFWGGSNTILTKLGKD